MPVIKDFDDDFGFTIVAEEELNQSNKIRVAEVAIQDLRKMMEPLLNNLASGSDDSVIKWPGRKAKIAEFKKRLDDHVADSLKKLR